MLKPYRLKKQKTPFKLLIFGDPGLGKTEFASTANDHEDLKDCLFLNIEGGLKTIEDKDVLAVDIGTDENGNRVPIIAELEQLMWTLMSDKRPPELQSVKTLVIDSVSDLQTKNLQDITSARPDKDMIQQNDYGKDTARLKRIFSMLRAAPFNVIFTALAKKVEDSEGKVIDVVPQLTNQVSTSLMGYVDYAWYIFKDDKTGERKLLTSPKGPIRAKTRNEKAYQAIGEIVVLHKGQSNLANIYTKMLKATEG